MRLKKIPVLFIFLLVMANSLFGQSLVAVPDSSQVTEAHLVQERQQQQIDSLVKIQLEAQLKGAVGDRKKTEDLEKQLPSFNL